MEIITANIIENNENIFGVISENAETITANIIEAVSGIDEYEYRHKYVEPISWIGKAVLGSSENDAVWTVTKIDVYLDGTTIVQLFLNKKWSEI